MREVSRDQFFSTVGPMNVHPRSEKEASYWETPSRQLIGRTEPGYLCHGATRYFLQAEQGGEVMDLPPSMRERTRAVENFNARYSIGAAFWAYTGLIGENPIAATLRTPAELLGGHTPVAWLDGVSGCVALTHLKPRPSDKEGGE